MIARSRTGSPRPQSSKSKTASVPRCHFRLPPCRSACRTCSRWPLLSSRPNASSHRCRARSRTVRSPASRPGRSASRSGSPNSGVSKRASEAPSGTRQPGGVLVEPGHGPPQCGRHLGVRLPHVGTVEPPRHGHQHRAAEARAGDLGEPLAVAGLARPRHLDVRLLGERALPGELRAYVVRRADRVGVHPQRPPLAVDRVERERGVEGVRDRSIRATSSPSAAAPARAAGRSTSTWASSSRSA